MKSRFERNKIKITLNNLLSNDFHIGESARFWHPSMNSAVLGSIDVIPLVKRVSKNSKEKSLQKKSSNLKGINGLKSR